LAWVFTLARISIAKADVTAIIKYASAWRGVGVIITTIGIAAAGGEPAGLELEACKGPGVDLDRPVGPVATRMRMNAMSKFRYALAACVAMCLAAGVAAAQTTTATPQPPTDTSVPSPGQGAPPPAVESAPQPDSGAAAPTIAGGPVAPTGNVQTLHIASPPVPDTPENRAKYGSPMSHAGRRTKPAGD
jgi:hypothetical protein